MNKYSYQKRLQAIKQLEDMQRMFEEWQESFEKSRNKAEDSYKYNRSRVYEHRVDDLSEAICFLDEALDFLDTWEPVK